MNSFINQKGNKILLITIVCLFFSFLKTEAQMTSDETTTTIIVSEAQDYYMNETVGNQYYFKNVNKWCLRRAIYEANYAATQNVVIKFSINSTIINAVNPYNNSISGLPTLINKNNGVVNKKVILDGYVLGSDDAKVNIITPCYLYQNIMFSNLTAPEIYNTIFKVERQDCDSTTLKILKINLCDGFKIHDCEFHDVVALLLNSHSGEFFRNKSYNNTDYAAANSPSVANNLSVMGNNNVVYENELYALTSNDPPAQDHPQFQSIYVLGKGTTIHHNTIKGFKIPVIGESKKTYGIIFTLSDDPSTSNDIYSNTIDNFNFGISYSTSDNRATYYFYGNTIKNCYYGFTSYSSKNNLTQKIYIGEKGDKYIPNLFYNNDIAIRPYIVNTVNSINQNIFIGNRLLIKNTPSQLKPTITHATFGPNSIIEGTCHHPNELIEVYKNSKGTFTPVTFEYCDADVYVGYAISEATPIGTDTYYWSFTPRVPLKKNEVILVNEAYCSTGPLSSNQVTSDFSNPYVVGASYYPYISDYCVESAGCQGTHQTVNAYVTVKIGLSSTFQTFQYQIKDKNQNIVFGPATGTYDEQITIQGLSTNNSEYTFCFLGPNAFTQKLEIPVSSVDLRLISSGSSYYYYKDGFEDPNFVINAKASLIASSCSPNGNINYTLQHLNSTTQEWETIKEITETPGQTVSFPNLINTGQYLPYGRYKLHAVSDYLGCTASTSFEIREKSLHVAITHQDPSCNNGNDGRIDVFLSGIYPAPDCKLTYGSNILHGTSFTNLSAGTYTVIIGNDMYIEVVVLESASGVTGIPVIRRPVDDGCYLIAGTPPFGGTPFQPGNKYTYVWYKVYLAQKVISNTTTTGYYKTVSQGGNSVSVYIKPGIPLPNNGVLAVNTDYEEDAEVIVYTDVNTWESYYYNPSYGKYKVKVIDSKGCESAFSAVFEYNSSRTRTYNLCFGWVSERQYYPPPVIDIPSTEGPSIIASQIKNAIEDQLNKCNAKAEKELLDNLVNHCNNADEISDVVSFKYLNQEQHYTLYYYDDAGRLTKTVPPKGVDFDNNRFTSPDHTLFTSYKYNSLNQLLSQKLPDQDGPSNFIYNNTQLRFSQNAQQESDKSCSYSKYDYLGRIVESGIIDLTNAITYSGGGLNFDITTFADLQAIANMENDVSYETLPFEARFPLSNSTYLSQVTSTIYSTPAPNINFYGKPQRYTDERVSYVTTINKKFGNETTAEVSTTYYSYDPHGNVEWLIQELPDLGKNYVSYEYDLISNKVTQLNYNPGKKDQFYVKYEYDANNRISKVFTSADGYLWDNDAKYQYYAHGPLKRTVIGEEEVQGLDYVYTIQGWLKSVNHPSLLVDKDPGLDGSTGSTIPPDIYGMTLNYYEGDFNRLNSPFNSNSTNQYYLDAEINGDSKRNLYNGNISSWTSNVNDPFITARPGLTGQKFTYDPLDRITASTFWKYNNGWTSCDGDFNTSYIYDPNGNITHLSRNAYNIPGVKTREMDDLTYHYDLNSNKLIYIEENPLITVNWEVDLKIQPSTSNYGYDRIGNLVKDESEEITNISWTASGKISSITKVDGSLYYSYDAMGNRIKKRYVTTTGTVITYYVRDAQGNILATYDRSISGNPATEKVKLMEQPIYGSDRLGMRTEVIDMYNVVNNAFTNTYTSFKIQPQKLILPYTTTTGFGELKYDPLSNLFTDNGTYTTIQTGADIKQLSAVFTEDGATRKFTFVGCQNYTFNTVTYPDAGLVLDIDGNVMPGSNPATHLLNVKSDGYSATMPVPGQLNRYYLFTVGNDNKLYRHTIDMNALGNGPSIPKGDVIEFNTLMDDANYLQSFALLRDNRYHDETAMLFALRSETDNSSTLVAFIINKESNNTAKLEIDNFKNSVAKTSICISPDGKQMAVLYRNTTDNYWYARLYKFDVNYEKPVFVSQVLLENTDVVEDISFSNDNNALYYIFNNSGTVYLKETTLSNPPASSTITVPDNLVPKTLTIGADNNGNKIFVPAKTATAPYLQEMLVLDRTTGATVLTTYTYTPGPTGSELILGLVQNETYNIYNKDLNDLYTRSIGNKQYELKDHLGNVTAVIEDYKTPVNPANLSLGYTAKVSSSTNYYPFGMMQPGRNHNPNDYRFGFNGKENDNEVKGIGNQQDYGMRIYDPRIAKFLSIDPFFQSYPWYTPYQFAGNDVIRAVDVDGKEPEYKYSIISNKIYWGNNVSTFTALDTRMVGTYYCIQIMNYYGEGTKLDLWSSSPNGPFKNNQYESSRKSGDILKENGLQNNGKQGSKGETAGGKFADVAQKAIFACAVQAIIGGLGAEIEISAYAGSYLSKLGMRFIGNYFSEVTGQYLSNGLNGKDAIKNTDILDVTIGSFLPGNSGSTVRRIGVNVISVAAQSIGNYTLDKNFSISSSQEIVTNIICKGTNNLIMNKQHTMLLVNRNNPKITKTLTLSLSETTGIGTSIATFVTSTVTNTMNNQMNKKDN